MPILNYTTTIAALKTAGEVQAMLAKHGAEAIDVDTDEALQGSLKDTILAAVAAALETP